VTVVRLDTRAIALARGAVNDARGHVSAASRGVRCIVDGPGREAMGAAEAVEASLLNAWESLNYVDQMLAVSVGEDPT